MKKLLSLALACSVVVLMTACKGKETTTKKDNLDLAREKYASYYNVDLDGNGTPDWQEQQISLTFGLSWYGAENQYNPTWLNVEKFMEKYPNITITRDPDLISGWDNGDDGLLIVQEAKAKEGTLPDIYFNPKSAETYDKGMTLDLTPYLETDEEYKWVSQNIRSGITSYDGKEIFGLPWQLISNVVALNAKVFEDNNIELPDYDWTYAEYEAKRAEFHALNKAGQCVYAGPLEFADNGPNYFDGVPNGFKGFNIETRRFEINTPGWGKYFEDMSREITQGLLYWDQTDEQKMEKCGFIGDAWEAGVRAIHRVWLADYHYAINVVDASDQMDLRIYPWPQAPEGGETSLVSWLDFYSLNSALSKDKVKAEAAYNLLKWLTIGEDGLKSRWNLMYEYVGDETFGGEGTPDENLAIWMQGWPATSNPEVINNHPLVKGFDHPLLNQYNKEGFKNAELQRQLSNGNPFPRHIPGFQDVANRFNPWLLRDDVLKNKVLFSDVAAIKEEELNRLLDEYLLNYNRLG